ncbi:alpha/beta hydrolase [Ramlibacter sp.]|uniref:alpha/beta fold hydrolase n=1 Tax=Ramlibacter sp. TaxID=1917967 RepID=UPI0018387621|nr:alpha/beta hydrolase [Ramlibacter sp.]MBA2675767.1 alpha/beta hydrolase [Ramlibacter sp.]
MPSPFLQRARFAGARVLSVVAPGVAARITRSVFTTAPRIRPMRPEEQALFARAERGTVAFRNYRIPTWSWGNKSAPRVLLSHGWGVAPAFFGPLVERLVAQGWNVTTYLGPAHADGDPPRTTGMTLVHALRALVDTLGPFDALVGHSLGAGMIVMGSKIGIGAERLVLISPVTDLVDHTDRFAGAMGMSRKVAARMRRIIREEVAADFKPLGRDWDELFETCVEAPTLLVHDENDELMGVSQSEYIVQRWPNARLVRTQGLGHVKILRNPAVVDGIAQFLDASPALQARAAANAAA